MKLNYLKYNFFFPELMAVQKAHHDVDKYECKYLTYKQQVVNAITIKANAVFENKFTNILIDFVADVILVLFYSFSFDV